MNRDWLRKKYPDGVGLGDLIELYISYSLQLNSGIGGQELDIRLDELKETINHLNHLGVTPKFDRITSELKFER